MDYVTISSNLQEWLDTRSGSRAVARARPPVFDDPPPANRYIDPDETDDGSAAPSA